MKNTCHRASSSGRLRINDATRNDGKEWHEKNRSTQKRFVALDASTGGDGHCQAANRLRLAQEMCGWMDTIFRT
jgi:hypothetical protein